MALRFLSRFWSRLPRSLRGFLLYNALFFPAVAAIYIPYNVLWIQMTQYQLLKWVATAAVFGSIANIGLAPWIRYVNRWLGRRGYYLGKEVGVPAGSAS